MITIAECRLQCNLDVTEVDFDAWFQGVIPASVLAISNQIDRNIYETQEALDVANDDTGIVINDSLKLGMLMLIGHWFNNRESVSTVSMSDTPQALDYLIQPYRCMAGLS